MIRLLNSPTYAIDNISGTTGYLSGNLFTKVTFNAQFEVETFIRANDDRIIEFGDENYQTTDYVTDPSGGFAEFKQGDNVELSGIKDLDGNTLVADGTYAIDLKVDDYTVRLTGATITRGVAYEGVIRLADEPQAIGFAYNLIENDEGATYSSKVDGQELRYGFDSVPTGTLQAMSRKFKASAEIGSVSVKKISEDLTLKIWRYEIEQVIYINPFFLVTQLGILQDGGFPNYFDITNALKHIFRFRAYQDNSSSENFQELEITELEGNTGWIGENYNSGDPQYTLQDVTYSNTIGQLTKDGTTTLTINVDEVSAASGFVVLNFISLPELAEQYQNLNSSMIENFTFDRVEITVGGGAVNGDNFGTDLQVFENCTATSAAGVTSISADVTFGADVQARIDELDSDRYLVVAEVIGTGQAAGTSNATNVRVDFNNIGVEVPTDTLTTECTFLRHDFNEIIEGVTNPTLKANDESVANALIYVKNDVFPEITLEKLTVSIIATDGTNEAELQRYEIETSGYQLVDGARLVRDINPTGLNVRPDEIRANYKLIREPDLDTANQYAYRLVYPFLFRWEYWEQLKLPTLISDFYDPAEQFDGFNQNWNRLGDFSGYGIFFRITVQANTDAGIVSTSDDYELLHKDYDDNSALWVSKETKFFDQATEIDYIKDGVYTAIQTDWTNVNAVDSGSYFATFQIGKKENHTFKSINTFSSIYDREGVSYLSSNGGDGKVVLSNVSANVIRALCYINPNKFPADGSVYTVFPMIDFKGVPFILSFITTNEFAIDGNFDPDIIVTTGKQWTINYGNGDVDTFTGTTFITYTDYNVSGDKVVVLTFASVNDFLGIDIDNDQIKGVVDFSKAIGISNGVLDFDGNPQLTGFLFPQSDNVQFGFIGCNISGVLDTTNITNARNNIRFSDINGNSANINLTNILFSHSTSAINAFYVAGCDITGTFDISMLTNFSGDIVTSDSSGNKGNANMTEIIFPSLNTGSVNFIIIGGNSCETIDLGGFTTQNNGGWIVTSKCLLLNSLTLPIHSSTLAFMLLDSCNLINGVPSLTNLSNYCNINNGNYRFQNNNMTQSAVDQILVDTDAIATGGFTGRSINIAGTNAAPSATGTTAKNNLITKGFTVTTN